MLADFVIDTEEEVLMVDSVEDEELVDLVVTVEKVEGAELVFPDCEADVDVELTGFVWLEVGPVCVLVTPVKVVNCVLPPGQIDAEPLLFITELSRLSRNRALDVSAAGNLVDTI